MIAQKQAYFYGSTLSDQIFCYFSSPNNFLKYGIYLIQKVIYWMV